MARPTPTQLTTAGFALASGSATKYAKTAGTAVATVDLAAGTEKTGVVALAPATPGTFINPADWAAHAATLNSLGISVDGENPVGGLVYYGQSV
jgi:hypothetical protein